VLDEYTNSTLVSQMGVPNFAIPKLARQEYTYDVILRRVLATIVAVEKQ